MKIAVLIATRLASKRIKNKSLKNFGRQNLTNIKLLQAKELEFLISYIFHLIA